MEILYGLHPVEESLRSGSRRISQVAVARDRHDKRMEALLALCHDQGIAVRHESRDALTRAAGNPGHQGVVAFVRERAFTPVEDVLAAEKPLLLAFDGVEDPQNLGALLRTAEGAGVHGVILTERRAAPLTPAALKASAGAAEHLQIARVVNLVRALESAKERNIWVVGLDERGAQDYDAFDFTAPTLLVLGREGAGLHDLVRRTCDHLLRIPMAGQVASLNVSAAGAVVLYEAFRQRRAERSEIPAAPSKPAKPLKGLGS
jgi:23S rRNA (guanosine2251-2'-O)-methyltransferase